MLICRKAAVTPSEPEADPEKKPPVRRAGPLQVAKTMFFGLFAIGMKGTWEKDGVKVTPGQIVVGAFIGGIVLVAVLIMTVRLVLRLALG